MLGLSAYFYRVRFVFPFFLLAGLTLLIPVLIHLFNLRRYKKVLFPDTRFLKSLQLRSRKQSQLRYKWLLAMRLLFLVFLVLAFAQPFWGSDQKTAGTGLQVLYLDNSQSMQLKKGPRTLLEAAQNSARQRILNHPSARFLIVTNDGPLTYSPLPPAQAVSRLEEILPGRPGTSNEAVLEDIQSLLQSLGGAQNAAVYYYSDFQEQSFTPRPSAALTQNLTLHYVPFQSKAARNVYVDTAWLEQPLLQAGQSNAVVVRTKASGPVSENSNILQLSIGGQVKSAATISFPDATQTRTDTLAFTPPASGWQQLSVYVDDGAVPFDDTFYIAARSSPGFSVLHLTEGTPSPFISAAFRSSPLFQLQQADVGTATSQDWQQYNLIVLSGLTRMEDALAIKIRQALSAGQSVALFPAKTLQPASLNQALNQIGGIRISGLDSSRQMATALQAGSPLVRTIFETIPQNTELPEALWHYRLSADLSANMQPVISFRNGDPLLATFSPGQRGKFYMSAVSANLEGGNFPASYFFAPFLYQMAAQSKGGDVYALTAGNNEAAFIPTRQAGERNMVRLLAPGMDAIPPQQPAAGGVLVYPDRVAAGSGFYTLAAPRGDTAVIGWNTNRTESASALWDIAALKKETTDAAWEDADSISGNDSERNNWPWWRVCAVVALVWLGVESWLLLRKQRDGSSADSYQPAA